jgi:hypothetical protein
LRIRDAISGRSLMIMAKSDAELGLEFLLNPEKLKNI